MRAAGLFGNSPHPTSISFEKSVVSDEFEDLPFLEMFTTFCATNENNLSFDDQDTHDFFSETKSLINNEGSKMLSLKKRFQNGPLQKKDITKVLKGNKRIKTIHNKRGKEGRKMPPVKKRSQLKKMTIKSIKKNTRAGFLKSAIYRKPGNVVYPFVYEGGRKASKFRPKEDSKRFKTFLDAYNCAINAGFVTTEPIKDWFQLIEESAISSSSKRLLLTFNERDFALSSNFTHDNINSQSGYRSAIYRAPGKCIGCPFIFNGGKFLGRPSHFLFSTFLDAYNFAMKNGFDAERHKSDDWFGFVGNVENVTNEKELLVTFRRDDKMSR